MKKDDVFDSAERFWIGLSADVIDGKKTVLCPTVMKFTRKKIITIKIFSNSLKKILVHLPWINSS